MSRLGKIQLSLLKVRVKVKRDSVLNVCWHGFKLKEIIFPSGHLYIIFSPLSIAFEKSKPPFKYCHATAK